jgi:subtilisin family serine protease
MAHVIAVRLAEGPHSPTQPAAGGHWILAPGSEVLTTFPHGAYNFISGSSFAAAHVSGVVALLLELQPALSADRIISILQATAAHTQPSSASPWSGVVNACVAIAQLRGLLTCAEPYQHASSL